MHTTPRDPIARQTPVNAYNDNIIFSCVVLSSNTYERHEPIGLKNTVQFIGVKRRNFYYRAVTRTFRVSSFAVIARRRSFKSHDYTRIISREGPADVAMECLRKYGAFTYEFYGTVREEITKRLNICQI